MSRILLTVIDGLAETYRTEIRKAAEAGGFEALFFNRPEDCAEWIPKAEIIFGQQQELACGAAELKWLCTPSAGFNQFADSKVFLGGQAVLSNSSGAYGVTISEHVIMTLLTILRRQQEYNMIVQRREWKRDLPVRSIKDSRITLAGTGDIGRETSKRLRVFQPASITGVNRGGRNPGDLFDRIVTTDEWETVLPETDVLIMSLPGTPETRGILGRDQLALLPDGAVIINVGRGSLIDQTALEKELRAGRLYAGLDVFEQEPIPTDDTIWDCPNLMITPHIAGNMTLPYTVKMIVGMFLEDFEHYCAGEPIAHRADPRKGY